MPCRMCGITQVDPVRGSSPWARGVENGVQILVCPDCQAKDPEWRSMLDRCEVCGGTRLSKILGTTLCRDCGHQRDHQDPATSL